MKTTTPFHPAKLENVRRQPRWTMTGLALGASVLLLTGCAQYAAMTQPGPFKPTATVVGAERGTVIAELGSPVVSTERGESLKETYKYLDGGGKNGPASKTARVVVYTAGDVFTVFLDQLLTWPVESYVFAGTSHAVTVDYIKGEGGFWCAKKVSDVDQGRAMTTDWFPQATPTVKDAGPVDTAK